MLCHSVLGTAIFQDRGKETGIVAVPLTLTSFSKICLSILKLTLLSNAFTKLSCEFDPINFKSLSNLYQCSFASRKTFDELFTRALTLQALKYTLHFKHIPQAYWSQSTPVDYKHVLKVGDLYQCLLNTNLSMLKCTRFRYTKNEADPLIFSICIDFSKIYY